jgi:hypothetical protein
MPLSSVMHRQRTQVTVLTVVSMAVNYYTSNFKVAEKTVGEPPHEIARRQTLALIC